MALEHKSRNRSMEEKKLFDLTGQVTRALLQTCCPQRNTLGSGGRNDLGTKQIVSSDPEEGWCQPRSQEHGSVRGVAGPEKERERKRLDQLTSSV